MALVTLCPGCGTTYKIIPEQLQSQSGLVRCGECQVIFNGFATLITIDESEIQYQSTFVEKTTASDNSDEIKESVHLADTSHCELQADTSAAFQSDHVQDEAVKTTESSESGVGIEPSYSLVPSPYNVSSSDFLSEVSQKSPQHWGWKFGNIALFILLIAQVIYMYRADLAIIAPQSRPYLEQYCNILGCTVPLPGNVQLLSIVSSDMTVRDPETQPEVATLTAVVRNHAPVTQALPALKLLLTDMHNQLLASRIFTTTDYLTKAQIQKTAIQPNQEIIIQIYLDNSQLKSTGYHLELLYL
ncbi:zinc-ribbon and DUF3426 domain-containing protein [Nitrosomonas aestuarii]|uniref:zinc-ribbon and DUF3426 domain-containing protein n=1 Tax=Nitrosomonas aestuarii TaxID=52441 RepID=UPI000D2F7112|nr:zinc-ribbon and DUF3426 domain-containing protein [Nitrosomonas aestuarii]PTN12458.1 putative Zn finger-like uncharacterized protein [Nitrosomonas aestuarii]